jgi:hypothetical protein
VAPGRVLRSHPQDQFTDLAAGAGHDPAAGADRSTGW